MMCHLVIMLNTFEEIKLKWTLTIFINTCSCVSLCSWPVHKCNVMVRLKDECLVSISPYVHASD